MKFKQILLGIFVVIFVVVIIFALNNIHGNTTETPTPTPTVVTTTVPVTLTPTVTEEVISYPNEKSPAGYTNFFEKMPVISGEQAYVAYPKTTYKNHEPDVIIYYHGSTQRITTNFKDEVMKNMRKYGAYMTDKNMVFLASNQHGDNWGSKTSVEDSRSLIAWVRKNYPTSANVYVLGFSMGGMPAMKHVILYPNEVKKIALLAPANQVENYTTAQIKLFAKVPLKIWHGTADVNVPYSATKELVDDFTKQHVSVEVVALKGKVHWDVDTEYMADVYQYYIKQ